MQEHCTVVSCENTGWSGFLFLEFGGDNFFQQK